MRGGRVREGDLCAIKIVKALGSCGGGVDTEEDSSSKTEHTSQRKKSQHSTCIHMDTGVKSVQITA